MTPRLAGALALFAFVVALPVSAQDEPATFFVGADTEKAQLDAFRKVYRGSDPNLLAEAIRAFGEASRRLEDGGSSRTVAKTIARGFAEDDFAPRIAAAVELAWGRHPDTVIDVLDDALDETRNEIQKRIGRPDEESRTAMRDATNLFQLICAALSYHHDDRAVDVLSSQARRLSPSSKGNNLSAALITPLSDALLELGQRDGVELIVRTTSTFVGANQRSNAKRLHTSLSTFSNSIGYAPPAFDDTFDQSWRAWFDEHEDEFVESFDKLEGPIERPMALNRRAPRMGATTPEGPQRP